MKFVKSADGETVSAIDATGKTVAYIKKNRFGTHGHWHGWKHYTWCESQGKCVWCAIDEDVIFPDRPHVAWKAWTDAPPCFSNIKEFKAYWEVAK